MACSPSTCQFYGDEEFVPVTRERLVELDPKRRAFGLHLEPTLERLAAQRLPGGWSLGEQVYDES